jgi:hypothetical protein
MLYRLHHADRVIDALGPKLMVGTPGLATGSV